LIKPTAAFDTVTSAAISIVTVVPDITKTFFAPETPAIEI
jgi:hypothetical protein